LILFSKYSKLYFHSNRNFFSILLKIPKNTLKKSQTSELTNEREENYKREIEELRKKLSQLPTTPSSSSSSSLQVNFQ
jgi:hypothetical protein